MYLLLGQDRALLLDTETLDPVLSIGSCWLVGNKFVQYRLLRVCFAATGRNKLKRSHPAKTSRISLPRKCAKLELRGPNRF
jgi:hypothetical protein